MVHCDFQLLGENESDNRKASIDQAPETESKVQKEIV